jgi:hypothetical protein
MYVEVIPESFPRAIALQEIGLAAATNLGMPTKLSTLRLVLDAPEFEDAGYWQIEDPHGSPCAILYASIVDLLTPRSREDSRKRDLDEERLGELTEERFDRLGIDRWIHRNLLQLDDLLEARIDPRKLTRAETAAFQACWEVWTDGRLKRMSLPGTSLAERRRVFFRVFARGGLLLPHHWRVFHQLWDGGLQGHAGLTEAVRRLPPVT